MADHVDQVKEYLNIREINGYTIHYTSFHPADGSSTMRTLVYIGTPENDQFTGPQDPAALAIHIYRSEGPSGRNIDYLLGLEQALASLGPDSGDEHVSDLSDRVRAINQNCSLGVHMRSPHFSAPAGFYYQKSYGTEEQEDI